MDKVSKETRSKTMAAVRSSGNRSTEIRFRNSLAGAGIRGWQQQLRDLPGSPDFGFKAERVAVFLDGCFWHGCPRCYRRPASSQQYWDLKVQRNIERDRRNKVALRQMGWLPVRIWEHTLSVPADARKIVLAALTRQRRASLHIADLSRDSHLLGKERD